MIIDIQVFEFSNTCTVGASMMVVRLTSMPMPSSLQHSLFGGSQGFIQDFRGGGASVTVQPPTLHEVGGGGGGNYASTDLIGLVGSARFVLQFMAVR